MAKIFLVSEGEYSDYGVVGVFTTEALAEEYIAKQYDPVSKHNHARIEEYELDPVTEQKVWQEVYHYREDRSGVRNSVHRQEVTAGWRGEAQLWKEHGWSSSKVSADHAKKLLVEAKQKALREKKAYPIHETELEG